MENSTIKCFLIATAAFVAGAILTYFVMQDGGGDMVAIDCPKCDYSAELPFGKISPATAHALANKYATECEPALRRIRPQGADNEMDARSTNFSIPALKKYIWDIESKVCKQEGFNVNDLGIRFYYGKYPNLKLHEYSDLADVDTLYSYRHTLFLVPTIKEGDIIRDINPDRLAAAPSDVKANEVDSNAYIMNHGNASPPPFPPKNQPSTGRSSNTGMNF